MSPRVQRLFGVDDLSTTQPEEDRAATLTATAVEEAAVDAQAAGGLFDGQVGLGGHERMSTCC